MKFRLFLAIIAVIFSGCVHKTQMIVQPATTTEQPTCDTLNLSYKKDIQPIFNNNCYSCHGTSVIAASGGLDLQDTGSLKQYLKYDFRGDSLYGSKLYHCMLHSFGTLQMPPTYTVDSCSLKKIKTWLNAGGPLN